MFYFESTERKLYLCFYLDSGPKLSVRQADGLFAARIPETLYRDTARSDSSPVSLGHFLDLSVFGSGCGHWGPELGG